MIRLIAARFLAMAFSIYVVAGSTQCAPMGPGSALLGAYQSEPLVQQIHRRPWSHCHSAYGYPYCHSNYRGRTKLLQRVDARSYEHCHKRPRRMLTCHTKGPLW